MDEEWTFYYESILELLGAYDELESMKFNELIAKDCE